MPRHRATVPSRRRATAVTRAHGLTRSYQPPSAATQPAGQQRSRVRARSGSRIPVRTARCSRVAGSQSKASSTTFWRGSGGVRGSAADRSGGGGEAERHEHVGGVEHGRAPVGDQAVRARATTGCARSRGRPSPGCRGRRPPCTVSIEPPAACDSTTTTRCDSAAMIRLRAGNRHASGRAPSGASLRSTPAVAHALPQVAVLGRVHDVEPAADHADRTAARLEHAAVRGAVDAERQAGHHRDARVGELAAELAREPGAGAGAAAGADDRHAHVGRARRGRPGRTAPPGARDRRAARPGSGGRRAAAWRCPAAWCAASARCGSAVGSPPTSRPARLGPAPVEQLGEPARTDRRVTGEQDRVAERACVGHAVSARSSGVRRRGVDAEAQGDGDVRGGDDVARAAPAGRRPCGRPAARGGGRGPTAGRS